MMPRIVPRMISSHHRGHDVTREVLARDIVPSIDRKSTRLNSSHGYISYAAFCLKKKIHCVTRWSKLDTTWQGVSLDVLLAAVEHESRYALAFSDGGYTTNMPVADLLGGKAWVSFNYEGAPLGAEHGGPARLLVPPPCFLQSPKGVRGVPLPRTAQPGFL